MSFSTAIRVTFRGPSFPWRRRQWKPLQHFCLGNPMDGGAWWPAVHGVTKSQTRLSDFTFTFHFHALEKETATHSSVLAWRTPGTGEPGGLPSMGSHRVGPDWSDLAAAVYRECVPQCRLLHMPWFSVWEMNHFYRTCTGQSKLSQKIQDLPSFLTYNGPIRLRYSLIENTYFTILNSYRSNCVFFQCVWICL